MYTSTTNLFFHHHLTSFYLLFLLVSLSTFIAQGRTMVKVKPVTPVLQEMNEEKMMILRGQIGSRPPKCEMRCSSCGHCEAIQVPTNSQINGNGGKVGSVGGKKKNYSTIAYSRGDDHDNYSNYKPMSWKCKCGKYIFNP